MSRPLIVVPAWNEAQGIATTLQRIRTTLPDLPVVVVDDGSTDGTGAAARAAGADVLQLPYNLGVGGAMRAGFKYAIRNGFDTVVQVDADGQHDPAAVPHLLAALTDADVVIGARFAGAGAYVVHGPRRWAMTLLAATLSRLSGQRLTDVTSGFRATGPRALALFATTYPTEYLGDTVESLTIGVRAGLRVRQVPVTMSARQHGAPSQSPVRSAIYLVRAVLALVMALIRRAPDELPSPVAARVPPEPSEVSAS